MNTENKKCCCRYWIFILFWTIIIALGFMLIPKGGSGAGSGSGTGSHGRGTGSGDHGFGSGKGQGVSGVNTGKSRSGDSPRPNSAESKKSVSAAAKASSKEGTKKPKDTNASGSGKLPVVSKDESSGSVATIYLAGKDPEKGSNSGTSAGFFGIEASGPVIFLLDVSGSMGATVNNEGMTRLDLVKKEVEKTLLERHAATKTKKSTDHFRIVCFSTSCHYFPDQNTHGYRFSSAIKVRDAIDFVNARHSSGGTNIMYAWQCIIPIIKTEEIQSVYFLTDGEDSSAVSLPAFLKNEVPQLTIHSIALGHSSELLKNLANQHQGQYREIK